MTTRQRPPWSVGLNFVVAFVLALGVLVIAPNVNTANAWGASYTVTQGCPYGGTLVGSTCTSSTPGTATQVPGCPNGGTLNSAGTLCSVPVTYEPTTTNSSTSYYCPSGGTLSGSGLNSVCSTTTASYAAVPFAIYSWVCSSGWSGPDGNLECWRVEVNAPHRTVYTAASYVQTGTGYSCPYGGSLSGTTCLGTTTMYAAASSTTFWYSCNSGGAYDSSYGSCVIEPYTYQPSLVAGTTTCAPNATPSGTNCVLSYPAQWIASEVICGTTYVGTGSTQTAAITNLNNDTVVAQGACIAAGTTYTYSAYAGNYSGSNVCNYTYYSDVSQAAATALAMTAAQTLCSGQTVATSNPVTGSYTDACTGLVYTATAQATEPGGGAAAAGTTAYNAAKAVATTIAENEAIAAEKAANGGVQGCGAIKPATYSATPVPGEVAVTSTEYRSGNGTSGPVTFTVCSPNGTTMVVTQSFTATYPVSGQGAMGTATVYSPNNATDLAAAQLMANTDAAAAAVTEANALATAAATNAAANAVALAAAYCAALGSTTTTTQPGSTTTTTQPGSTTTTTLPSGAVSTGAIAGGGTLDAVDCPTSSECIAVGYNTNFQSIWTVGTLSGTVWSWTPEVTIPSDSTGQGLLLAVGCPTATTCIATGGSAGGSTGLGVETVGTLANGSWTWTPEVDLTSDANGGGVLFSIACVSSTECVAGGDDHKWRGVATSVNLVNGTWTWGKEMMVGSDANGGGRLLAMSCPTTTECISVGNDDTGQSNFTIGTKGGGAWSWTSNKVIHPDNTGFGELDGVACPSAVLCIAVGYDNAQQGIESIGTNVGGNWTWTQESQVFIGAVPMGDFAGITCSSTALCSTVGYDGRSQGQAAGLGVLAGVPGWTDQLTINSPATGGGRLLAISSTGVAAYVTVGNTAVGIVIGS